MDDQSNFGVPPLKPPIDLWTQLDRVPIETEIHRDRERVITLNQWEHLGISLQSLSIPLLWGWTYYLFCLVLRNTKSGLCRFCFPMDVWMEPSSLDNCPGNLVVLNNTNQLTIVWVPINFGHLHASIFARTLKIQTTYMRREIGSDWTCLKNSAGRRENKTDQVSISPNIWGGSKTALWPVLSI